MTAKKRATPAIAIQQAELILHRYELRRETVMREARSYVGGEFLPASSVVRCIPPPACGVATWQRDPLRVSFNPTGAAEPMNFNLVGLSAVLVEDGDTDDASTAGAGSGSN